MDDGRNWPSSLQGLLWDVPFRSCLLPITTPGKKTDDDDDELLNTVREVSKVKHNRNSLTPNNDESVVDDSCCYLCTHCGKGCASERELNVHIADEHDDIDEPNDDPSVDDTNKSGHQYLCKFCPRTFSSSSTLNVHYTHTHRDKPQYDCEICGQGFTVKRELATHRRLHEGQPTHRCRQCGKDFGTKQLLRKHELWHTGERTHVCPQCGKAFFQKGHLTQHLMIHAGGRPHACHLCPKTFIFKFDLNRHMKIHAERGNNNNILLSMNGSTLSPPQSIEDEIQIAEQPSTVDDNKDNHQSNGVLLTDNHSNGVFSIDNLSKGVLSHASLTPIFRRRNVSTAFCRNNTNTNNSNSQSHSPNNAEDDQSNNPGSSAESQSNAIQNGEDSTLTPPAYVVPEDGSVSEIKGEVSPSSSSVYSNSAVYNCCDKCVDYRHQLETSRRCVTELETMLVQRHREIEALKWKVQRVGEVAGHLLETCSDFDKLWMLHSKKVYSQMQNVLSTLQ